MHITNLNISNYKSFYPSQEIKFAPGFNVFVGQNNVGKSALVEALSLQFNHKPHRSLKNVPRPGSAINSVSQVNITFEMERKELIQSFQDQFPNFFVPYNASLSPETQAEKFINLFKNNVTLKITYQPNSIASAAFPEYGEIVSKMAMKFSFGKEQDEPKFVQHNISTENDNLVNFKLANLLKRRIYCFSAERMNVGECPMGTTEHLKSDASNLAEVLILLQGNHSKFSRFNNLVSTVLPEIKQIAVKPISRDVARILVWSIDPATEREDLAMPLEESGTGIGQVLAILYVAVTANYPRVIAIDEPQSFLHPGAVRKLLEILSQYPQHQYIITTHSPTVVSSSNPQSLYLVRKVDAESVISPIDPSENEQLRIFLGEVGARLSDVFGADNILWVEGRTEELCFPEILSRLSKISLMGTAILGVRQTGDFEGRYSKTILEIYRKLCSGRGLLPPAIGFIFDKEGRKETELLALKSQSDGEVKFLPRRMYENYLLNPQAISSVTSGIEGFRDEEITTEEISEWLQKNRWIRAYFDTPIEEGDKTDDLWHELVHGAKILIDLFRELSDNRIEYSKVEHGFLLTKWIIENSPEDLNELLKLLEDAMDNRSNITK